MHFYLNSGRDVLCKLLFILLETSDGGGGLLGHVVCEFNIIGTALIFISLRTIGKSRLIRSRHTCFVNTYFCLPRRSWAVLFYTLPAAKNKEDLSIC